MCAWSRQLSIFLVGEGATLMAMVYKASKLWDTLPPNIIDSGTLMELKKLLKKRFSPFQDLYFQI